MGFIERSGRRMYQRKSNTAKTSFEKNLVMDTSQRSSKEPRRVTQKETVRGHHYSTFGKGHQKSQYRPKCVNFEKILRRNHQTRLKMCLVTLFGDNQKLF